MKKQKMYKYLGRNGNLTTPILLDGISYISMLYLQADSNNILTDGEHYYSSIIIEEKDINNWEEIPAKTN